MNEYLITAAVVLATLAAGLFLLLSFGISFVSYIAVGIIISVLLASLVYTWWKSKTDKTLVLLKIEILNRVKSNIERLRANLEEASRLADMEPFIKDLERIRGELISKGYFTRSFEVDERKIEKVTLTEIELESRKVEQQLRSLESLAAASCIEAAAARLGELLGAARSLAESGFSVSEEYQELRRVVNMPSASLGELLEKHRRGEELYRRILDRCIKEAEFLLGIAEGIADVGHLRRELEDIKQKKESMEIIPRLQRVRSEVSSYLTKPFLQARKEMVSYLDKVLSLSEGFEREHSALHNLREKVLSFSDPGLLSEFPAIEEEAKRLTLDLARALAKSLVSLEEELKELGIRARRRGIERQVSKLDPRMDFKSFAKEALDVLRALAKEHTARYRTVKIEKNYPAIEKIIARKLEEKGEVTPEELGVRYAEEFLRRYSEAHPETALEEGLLKLKG